MSPEQLPNKYAGKTLDELNKLMPRDPVEWQEWAAARALLKTDQKLSQEAEALAKKA